MTKEEIQDLRDALTDLEECNYDARTDVLIRDSTGHTFRPKGAAKKIFILLAYEFLNRLKSNLKI